MQTDHLPLRLGLVIRRHREALLLTQEEFAHAHGINVPYYSAVERGVQNLTLLSLARLARSLDIPPSVLLKEAEDLDLAKARLEPPQPPRRGRPRGSSLR